MTIFFCIVFGLLFILWNIASIIELVDWLKGEKDFYKVKPFYYPYSCELPSWVHICLIFDFVIIVLFISNMFR